MRTMFDAIAVGNLPPGAAVYAGYDDGAWPDAAAILARFHAPVVRVTVNPNDDEGDMLDVENGDATPTDAPGWVRRRRASGHAGPLVYMSASLWATVRQAFSAQGVPEPGYLVAAYDGVAEIPPGAIGKQYAGTIPPGYDISVVVDYLPGIDPAPQPEEDAAMKWALHKDDAGTGIWLLIPGPTGYKKQGVANPADLAALKALGAVTSSFSQSTVDAMPTVRGPA